MSLQNSTSPNLYLQRIGGKLLRQNKVKDWVSNNIGWKRASYTQQNRGIHEKNTYFQDKHLNKTTEKSGLQIDITEKTNRIFTDLDLLSLVFYIYISTRRENTKPNYTRCNLVFRITWQILILKSDVCHLTLFLSIHRERRLDSQQINQKSRQRPLLRLQEPKNAVFHISRAKNNTQLIRIQKIEKEKQV